MPVPNRGQCEEASVIVCPRCSKENQDHYKFCLGCGGELPRDAAQAPKSFTAPTPPAGMPAAVAPAAEDFQPAHSPTNPPAEAIVAPAAVPEVAPARVKKVGVRTCEVARQGLSDG